MGQRAAFQTEMLNMMDYHLSFLCFLRRRERGGAGRHRRGGPEAGRRAGVGAPLRRQRPLRRAGVFCALLGERLTMHIESETATLTTQSCTSKQSLTVPEQGPWNLKSHVAMCNNISARAHIRCAGRAPARPQPAGFCHGGTRGWGPRQGGRRPPLRRAAGAAAAAERPHHAQQRYPVAFPITAIGYRKRCARRCRRGAAASQCAAAPLCSESAVLAVLGQTRRRVLQKQQRAASAMLCLLLMGWQGCPAGPGVMSLIRTALSLCSELPLAEVQG